MIFLLSCIQDDGVNLIGNVIESRGRECVSETACHIVTFRIHLRAASYENKENMPIPIDTSI